MRYGDETDQLLQENDELEEPALLKRFELHSQPTEMLSGPSHSNPEDSYPSIQFLTPSLDERLQLSPGEADMKRRQSQTSTGRTTFFSNLTWCKNSTALLMHSKLVQSTKQELPLDSSDSCHLSNREINAKQLPPHSTPTCQLSPIMKILPSEQENGENFSEELHPMLLSSRVSPNDSTDLPAKTSTMKGLNRIQRVTQVHGQTKSNDCTNMSSPGIPMTSSLSPSSDLSFRKRKQPFACSQKISVQPNDSLLPVSPCLSFLTQNGTMLSVEDQSTSTLFSHLSTPSHQPLSTLSLLDHIRSNSPDQLHP